MLEKNRLSPQVASKQPPSHQRNCVIWMTGLSGAGKSTIAEILSQKLADLGHEIESLDGDRIRDVFPQTGFSRPERDAHVKRVGFMASRLEVHGVTVVASLISPYIESRDFIRGLCRNFIEVHIATPLHACEQRDPKGLYARARRGEIKNFTGLDDPYEIPLKAEITIATAGRTPESCADEIIEKIRFLDLRGEVSDVRA